jgi:hypothetical protein
MLLKPFIEKTLLCGKVHSFLMYMIEGLPPVS